MRLPRLTTRRLMVLVAVVALALYGSHLTRLRRHYEAIALRHGMVFDSIEMIELRDGTLLATRLIQTRAKRMREEYHARMRRKYERAARYPWLPVPPDPPPP